MQLFSDGHAKLPKLCMAEYVQFKRGTPRVLPQLQLTLLYSTPQAA